MQLRMWLYDLAREQAPSREQLEGVCRLSLEHGYNALGLYLEHRFAYPSVGWSAGKGCLTPQDVHYLEREFPDLQIVPFINLLGHTEGFLSCAQGHSFAEERFKGLQAAPTNPAFVAFSHQLLTDTLRCFKSELVHLGGDETDQLGKGAGANWLKQNQEEFGGDAKARLYAQHFSPLIEATLAAGRTPGLWGDMLAEHPEAIGSIAKETILFDWQYFRAPGKHAKTLREAGYRVVYCPTIHNYNAFWAHLPQSEQNVIQHVRAAHLDQAYGVCVTTWEQGNFGNMKTILPAIRACGDLISAGQLARNLAPVSGPDSGPDAGTDLGPDAGPGLDPGLEPEAAIEAYRSLSEAPNFLRAYLKEPNGERYEEWARLMGVELPTLAPAFAFSGHRSKYRTRFLMQHNPFLLWLRERDHLPAELRPAALSLAERAIAMAPEANSRGVSVVLKASVEFLIFCQKASLAYEAGKPGEAINALAPMRQVFEDVIAVARASALNAGGSLADEERAKAAKLHVERVIGRIKQFGDGSLGYLPSFESITHPNFTPYDQANWWMINRWALE